MITKATIKDISLIQDLAEKSWRSHYPGIISHEQIDFMLDLMYSEEEINRQFNNPNYHYYLLGDAENFYGIMGFENHYEQKTTKLHRIYITEEGKGKGRGKEAIQFLKNQILEVGDQRIILAVNKQNPSYHFYLSQGFKVYEEGVFDIGNGFVMDDYLMEWNA